VGYPGDPGLFGWELDRALPDRTSQISQTVIADEHRDCARQFRDNLFYEVLVASSVVSTD